MRFNHLLLLSFLVQSFSISVNEFCVDKSLDQLEYGGAQASMIQDQAALVQNQADNLNAVALMQQLRGGSTSGDSMTRIMKTHAWETKGLRYSQSLAFFAGPPIALGIVFFFFWIITATCRCCDTIEFDKCCSEKCGNCCLPEKKLADFTKCEKLCPLFTYITSGLLASVCSILGLLYLLQVANSVTGMVCDVENLRADTSLFLNNITVPLSNISTTTNTAVNKIKLKVGNATLVGMNFNATMEQLMNTSDYLNSISPPRPTYKTNGHHTDNEPLPCNCTFCAFTSLGLLTTKNELANAIGSTLDDLVLLETNVVNSVVNIGDQIISTVSTASSNSNFLVTFVNVVWKDAVALGMDSLVVVQQNVVLSATIFFGAMLVSMVLTMIGIFFLQCGKYTNCTGTFIDDLDDVFGAWLVFLGWFITGAVVIAMFIISGVLVPLAVIFSDVCVVLDDFPKDMHSYLDKIIVPPSSNDARRTFQTDVMHNEYPHAFSYQQKNNMKKKTRTLLEVATAAASPNAPKIGPSPVDVFIGCYNKQKLLDTLNMTSEFSFTNSLNFSSLQNFDSNALFNFTAFNILQKKMLERQSKPPDFIPLEYAWPRNESVHAPNCTAGAEYSLKTTNARMGQTEIYMEAMKQSSEDMFVSLSSIELDLLPLMIMVEDFVKDGGDCSFLHDHYHKLESRLCKETLPAMLYVGLLMFINGILGIVMVANGLIINKRYGGHGKKEGDDDKQVEDAASGFGDDFDEFNAIEDQEESEEEEEEKEPILCRECSMVLENEEVIICPSCKTYVDPEKEIEMVENQYVYDDAAHEMPYVDEYTHLDDEHYFAMEADHDAETAII